MTSQRLFAQITRAISNSAIWTTLCAGALLCAASLVPTAVSPQTRSAAAQSAKQVISLVSEPTAASVTTPVKGEASFANAPVNFHAFASAHVGENTIPERLTLHFAASTTLTQITSTKDFQVEQGSTCIEGGNYSAGESCTLLVRFTPQGAGRRLGKLTVSHTASATPFALGLGGYGYAPVVSFTPAVISTVSGTYPSSKGLLTSAQNLTVDGSDTLYIADTGNGIIRYLNSSGTVTSLVTGLTDPLSLASDNFGDLYFDEPSQNEVWVDFNYGDVSPMNGTGSGTCTVSSPCLFENEAVTDPQQMSMDQNNSLFIVNNSYDAIESAVQPEPANFFYISNPFAYQESYPDAFAVDADDNQYSFWNSPGAQCEIAMQTLYDAQNYIATYTKVAGTRACGYAGDGGQAGNAEISTEVGQIFFDIAGDMYFSDTKNQRVREINAVTGIINTIAGTGTAGYTGDSGAATSATLSSPTGVTVDSQGQVYIISAAAATGTAQVVRKLGPNGILAFGSQLKGSSSAAHVVTVTNIGNSAMDLTNAVFTGTNASAFKVDPTTTSCSLVAGATLNAGQTCKVGIIFTPTAAGSYSANFVMLDNTVTNSNTVQLTGTGTLPAPTFTITSPATGTSVTSGTAVTFAVSVTSSSSPAPTGTVTFKVGTTSLGTVTLSSGTASVSVTETTAATYTLSATYSGDSNYAAAGPITRTYTVTAAADSAEVKFTKPSATQAQRPTSAIALAVTVTAKTAPAPTGKVKFSVDGKSVATSAIVSGRASANAGKLAVGTHTLTAAYSGDRHHAASKTSEKITVSVSPEQQRPPQPNAAAGHAVSQ